MSIWDIIAALVLLVLGIIFCYLIVGLSCSLGLVQQCHAPVLAYLM